MPLIAFVIAAVAVISCVFMHLATMVVLSRTLDRWFKRAHWWAIGCMVLIAIRRSFIEISVFAFGIRLLRYLHNGEILQEHERFFGRGTNRRSPIRPWVTKRRTTPASGCWSRSRR